MKEKKTLRIFALVMLVAVISLYLITSTYASSITGANKNGSGLTFTGEEIKLESDILLFGVFDSINKSEILNSAPNVKPGKIAPGMGGKILLTITNDSEVEAEYTVDYTLSNDSNIPLEFAIDAAEEENWSSSISTFDKTVASIIKSGVETVSLYWRWSINSGVDNTTIGLAAADGTLINPKVTAEVMLTPAD